MTRDDLIAAEQISDEAFFGVEELLGRRNDPPPTRRTAERSARWVERTGGLLATDPDGCWVAEDAGGVQGFATSMVREDLWILSTFAVRPGHQGSGIGRRLLQRAQEYGAACSRALLSASDDPRALRRYHGAGFELLPQMAFRGTPRPTSAPPGLRAGTDEDLPWMDELDRTLRGAPHGPDHALILGMCGEEGLLVAEDRSGYAYRTDAALVALAARDDVAARRLLRGVLAPAGEGFELAHVTPANRWAVDIAMEAGLSVRTDGYLAVRGMAAPAPYVHNGALL